MKHKGIDFSEYNRALHRIKYMNGRIISLISLLEETDIDVWNAFCAPLLESYLRDLIHYINGDKWW